jgi:hypothetical protein
MRILKYQGGELVREVHKDEWARIVRSSWPILVRKNCMQHYIERCRIVSHMGNFPERLLCTFHFEFQFSCSHWQSGNTQRRLEQKQCNWLIQMDRLSQPPIRDSNVCVLAKPCHQVFHIFRDLSRVVCWGAVSTSRYSAVIRVQHHVAVHPSKNPSQHPRLGRNCFSRLQTSWPSCISNDW